MRKILGLDLGTTSVGWALVEEDESKERQSRIIKLGVRIIQYDNFNKIDKLGKVSESKNPIDDFASGKGLSPNAKRTQQRGARRNLQRFKQRRENLIEILLKNDIISKDDLLTEIGNNTTFQTLKLRAKSAREKVEKVEFARVLLAINKKRGYKSSRKAKNEEEGSLIDGMAVAKGLYDNNLTVGQYVNNLLEKGGRYIPDFYRSDLQYEFDTIWNFQKQFYGGVLNDALYKKLEGQGKRNSASLFLAIHQIYTAENKGKRDAVKKQHYKWRSEAINMQLPIDVVAYVLVEINNNLNNSSGYLGAIGDRSKTLYFNKETVGENLYKQIQKDPHTSLKNQVFYRQDYLDEFEQIWETQGKFYSELTGVLKEEVRDIIIFYQRKLKSQKHLISECEFEKHHKVIPKSSPLFQEFKIWQNLNNVVFTPKNENAQEFELNDEQKHELFEELNLRGNLKIKDVLKIIGCNTKDWDCNFEELEGNRTNEALYNVFQKITEYEGYGFDWVKKSAIEIKEELKMVFSQIGISNSILDFNSDLTGTAFDKQDGYQFWHLLYSAEEDTVLKHKLITKYGFKQEYASMLVNGAFQTDYGSLSTRAIKKILPYLKAGHPFSSKEQEHRLLGACEMAGYNHSESMTAEEREKCVLRDKLELLKKNSLRNPVVEKILNQMINVINQIIETYGKPDEIRIELARELKKSAKERAQMTTNINTAKTKHDNFRKLLQKEFGIKNPTRNDIIRYKLYEELNANGYRTIYTDEYIPKAKLFSKEIDIEHIIPKAKLFDDSFSNKTLAYRNINLEKRDTTAMDFINNKYSDTIGNYKKRIETLFNKGKAGISRAKRNKLLMEEKDIPDGFIDRDLRDSQYIAKKAKQLLEEVVRTVNTTTGTITSRLRDDWNLINVMQELNLPKFKAIDENLIEQVEKKDGNFKTRIKDWSKRNDHRHHAMDALTVAFTTYGHVQYLNNLNAVSKKDKRFNNLKENLTTTYEQNNGKKKRKFIKPMLNFREEAKKHIECILISFKAKNKVVTKNKNYIKGQEKPKIQLTPRGQLHKETVYGKLKEIVIREEKITAKFDITKINQVTKPRYREALLKRLEAFNGDAKKAFTGKNSLSKKPIYIDKEKTKEVPEKVKIQFFEDNYTIRKSVDPDLKIEKIIDKGVQRILQKRLDDFNGSQKEAFSNLDNNPIWLNKNKSIAIKRVRISGIKNAEALHSKKDHLGELILKEGKEQAVDFVSTGNNHHVAIYKDRDGDLQECVVSFYEAVARVNLGEPIVDEEFNKSLGWKFMFTMKQNEMFLFPSEGFNPNDVDLLDEKNTSLISANLFRVQKISTKNYMFAHHLETQVVTVDILKNKKQLSGHIYNSVRSTEPLRHIVKVRINHLGQIVQVGEYSKIESYDKAHLVF